MKIVLLGNKDTFHIATFIESMDDVVVCKDDKVSLDLLKSESFDFIISYGYSFILKEDIIQAYKGKAINLHISYLPWNRGMSPNFWSFLEGTPKGVTIHYLDEGIDTGDIIIQWRIVFNDSETLRTSNAILHKAMVNMFKYHWLRIRDGKSFVRKQVGVGSYHTPKEMEAYQHLMPDSWDTPVKNFAKQEG